MSATDTGFEGITPASPGTMKAIRAKLEQLPAAEQQEVLDFIECLLRKGASTPPSIFDKMDARSASVPDKAFDEIPADASEHMDHYLYGSAPQ